MSDGIVSRPGPPGADPGAAVRPGGPAGGPPPPAAWTKRPPRVFLKTFNPARRPEGLTAADWQAIQEALRAAEYHLSQDTDGSYTAPNRAQGWQVAFTPQGTQVTPRGGGWSWGLRLVGYGYGVKTWQVCQILRQADRLCQV